MRSSNANIENTHIAQRAYLGYKLELVRRPTVGPTGQATVEYRVIVINLGNTPADDILVSSVEFNEIMNLHFAPPSDQLPRKGRYVPPSYDPRKLSFSPKRPSEVRLGPKETVTVEGSDMFPPGSLPGHISGKIIYFDVVGDFHKQYYCTEVRLGPPLHAPPPATYSLVSYYLDECELFGREEWLPGPLVPPWNDEAIAKEYGGDLGDISRLDEMRCASRLQGCKPLAYSH